MEAQPQAPAATKVQRRIGDASYKVLSCTHINFSPESLANCLLPYALPASPHHFHHFQQ